MANHRDVRVVVAQGVCRRLDLGPANVLGVMERLAVQIRSVHPVEVDDAHGAHPGGG